jgi:hypothetical protein
MKKALTHEDLNQPLPCPLTVATLKTYWSKTYNTVGKPDWSHIFPFYHPDMTFHDSIQIIHGKLPFMKMCNRLTKRSGKLIMDLGTITQTDNKLLFTWTMTIVYKRAPSTPLYGATQLTLHEDGRIMHQRDFYDLWGDIYNNVPIWKKIYRWWMKTFFG